MAVIRPLLASAVLLLVTAVVNTTPSQKTSFQDVTPISDVRFSVENGATSEKKMIETMGSGAGMLDYDGDGRLDLIFVSGGGRPGSAEASHDRLALYRNLGSGKFDDRTQAAHLNGSFDTYGMGVAVGDYDNDGHPDLLLTGYPRSVLFHNNGDGTFMDVTTAAGVENKGRWGTSAGWFDYDRDGLLDLVIANYVGNFSWEDSRFCGDAARGERAYCHPDVYQGTGVRLYRNEGGGKFRDVTVEAGLDTTEGKCLGLVLADFDGDGWPDMFVANDSVMNFFYRNRGNGKFVEMGLESSAGFSDDGQAEAGMGVDAAYLDGDLYPSIYVTHLDNELNRLYRNLGKDHFRDMTIDAGLGAERSLRSGFGVRFADFDNSGRQQILVANGHILDNISVFHPRVSYREPMSLFQATGAGRFRDISTESGDVFAKQLLGRGLAIGDLDGDGRLDFVVSQNSGPPMIARNQTTGGNWVELDLAGSGKSTRDTIGAVVTINAAGREQRAQLMGGTSYCSASARRLHFGLGTAQIVNRVEVHWPSGHVDTLRNMPANRVHKVIETARVQ
jgi:hypothetical protein